MTHPVGSGLGMAPFGVGETGIGADEAAAAASATASATATAVARGSLASIFMSTISLRYSFGGLYNLILPGCLPVCNVMCVLF